MNQRRIQRGGSPNRPKATFGAQRRSPLGFGSRLRSLFVGFLGNIKKDSLGLAGYGYDSPLRALGSLLGVIGTLVSIVGFFWSGSSDSGGWNHANSWPITFPFSLRLGFFLLMTASIGWTVSTISIALTKHASPWAMVVARLGTLFAALFLATGIDWLFPREVRSTPGLVLALAVAGSAFAVYLAKTNFALTHEADVRVTASRAELLLVFALGLTIAVIVQHLIEYTP
jgi:hypothetical protein